MLSLDDEEVSTALLALEIASVDPMEATINKRDGKCRIFCINRFDALAARLRQYQKDAEEKADDR